MSNGAAGHGTGTHLAFFIPNFGDGGIERNAINLTREYLSRDYRVDIVTFQAEKTMRPEIPAGAGFVDLGTRRTLTSGFALAKYLRRTNCDVLISAQAHANIAAVIATTRGSRSAITARESANTWVHDGGLGLPEPGRGLPVSRSKGLQACQP